MSERILSTNHNTWTATAHDDGLLDDLTANWPVPDDMSEDLHAFMATHHVKPLAVYNEDKYVEPLAVNASLKYALVEVHFTLKHFCIRKRDAKPLDSFTGHIEQVIILKPGEARTSRPYKRKNMLDRPFRPKAFLPAAVNVTRGVEPTAQPAPGGSQHQALATPLLSSSAPIATTEEPRPREPNLVQMAMGPAPKTLSANVLLNKPTERPARKIAKQKT